MRSRRHSLKPHHERAERRGATVVEMAVTLPVIFLIFWGFWEWSRVEMIRQAAATAAYEGARRGILPGATTQQMEDTASEKLVPYGVSGVTMNSTIDGMTNRAEIQINIPLDQNLWGAGGFFSGKNVNSRFSLRREE